MQCPASYQEEQKLPQIEDASSPYADEGTALHEAIQYILENDIVDLDEVVGMTFYSHVMTKQLVAEALVPAIEFFDLLCDELEEEGGLDFVLETRVEVPGIPGAFGTGDVTGRTKKRSVIIDWKFGAGVLVKAEYENGDGSVHPNAQPMFYGRGGMFTLPTMFEEDKDWPVDLYIVQPRARDGFDPANPAKHSTTVGKLEEFRIQLIRAVSEAKGDNPRMKKGPWCRFAKCKLNCPLHLEPALDLTKMHHAMQKKGKKAIDWPAVFTDLLDACNTAEEFIKEVRTQAHAYLEAGYPIVDENGEPTYKLVEKRATERYVDEKGAQRHAIGLGVPEKDTVTTPEVISPAQLRGLIEPFMDAKTKKARTELAAEQLSEFTEKKSSGTTLAPVDDKRLDITPTPELVNRLADKLSLYKKQG